MQSLFRSSLMSNNCAVSLIQHGIPSVNGEHIDSIQRERCSMAVLHSDVRRRKWLPGFLPGCVFTWSRILNVYIIFPFLRYLTS